MRTSFSPGLVTAAYYVFAVPFTVVLGYGIFDRGIAISEMLADPTGEASVFSFPKIVAMLLKLIAGVVPFLLYFPMAWLGRKVRTKEQQRRQATRDRVAESFLEVKRSAPYKRPYALYLRPFSSTGKIQILWQKRIQYHKQIPSGRVRVFRTLVLDDLETVLAEAVESHAELVALGRPGEQIGAGRVLTDDAGWQSEFRRLTEGADRILIVPSTHDGTRWELQQLLANPNWLTKTILIVPPRPLVLERPPRQHAMKYYDFETRARFRGGGESRLDADEIHADAIACVQQLGIDLPRDSDNGLFVRVGAKRSVLSTVPVWVPKESLARSLWDWYTSQEVVKLSTAHIRRVVTQLPIARA